MYIASTAKEGFEKGSNPNEKVPHEPSGQRLPFSVQAVFAGGGGGGPEPGTWNLGARALGSGARNVGLGGSWEQDLEPGPGTWHLPRGFGNLVLTRVPQPCW